MQLSGFGSPAILFTNLAGWPLKSFIKYLLLPLSMPNSRFIKLTKARVAGES